MRYNWLKQEVHQFQLERTFLMVPNKRCRKRKQKKPRMKRNNTQLEEGGIKRGTCPESLSAGEKWAETRKGNTKKQRTRNGLISKRKLMKLQPRPSEQKISDAARLREWNETLSYLNLSKLTSKYDILQIKSDIYTANTYRRQPKHVITINIEPNELENNEWRLENCRTNQLYHIVEGKGRNFQKQFIWASKNEVWRETTLLANALVQGIAERKRIFISLKTQ